MKINKRQNWGFLLLLFVTLTYILIFFLLNPSQKQEIIELYFADKITAAHKVLIDKYNSLNEGKVKIIPIDFPNFDFSTNERKEMLARSLRGRGDAIDLFAVDLVWVQRFAKWCEPLDKYFSEAEKKRILGAALESCYYEGEMVAAPLDMVQGIMYYREDLIKNVVKSDEIIEKIKNNITWDEFIELRKYFNKEEPFFIFPAADNEGMICSYMELLLSLRKNYFEEEGFNLNTPEAEQALQLLVDLVNKYKTTPGIVTEFTEIPSYEYFINNDAVFIRGWNSYDKDFKESPFNAEKESHLRKAPVPHFKSGTPSSVFGGWNLMVSKFSNKKEYAIDFIKFLLKDESQEIFYKESGYYPVTNSFYENPVYTKKYPETAQFKEYMKAGVHRPAHIEYTKYSKIMSYFFKKAIENKMSVKEALAQCTNAIRTDWIMIKEF
ncbi:MAG: extracellular solute-binding protein [Ignavibacteriaceae bacterium]